MEELHIYNLLGVKTAVISRDILFMEVDEFLDQSETLKFHIPLFHPMVSFLVEDGTILWDGREWIIRELYRKRIKAQTRVEVLCEARWYELIGKKRVGSFVLSGATVAEGIESILSTTEWQIGNQTDTGGSVYSMEEQDKSVLELLRTWALITGTVLTFNTLRKTADLTLTRGIDIALPFRYGRNIEGIEKQSRAPEVTTLYPYGADGLTIAGVNGGSQSLSNFDWYIDRGLTLPQAQARYTKADVISNDSIITEQALLEFGQAQMANIGAGEIFYRAEVADLSSLTGIPETGYNIGDRVPLFDEDMGVDITTTIVRTTKYPHEPVNNKIELALLAPVTSSTSTSSRPSSSRRWDLFGSKSFEHQLRNDGIYTVNRIPLRFREGGEAFFGFSIQATGVDAGTLHISIEDTNNVTQVWPVAHIPYTNGSEINFTTTFFYQELLGSYDYRVRLHTVASGGPGASKGVDIDLEASHLWIHAFGAVQESPTLPNSVTFTPNGANPNQGTTQSWTVPDNVFEILVESHGAPGATAGLSSSTIGSTGAKIVGRFTVVPGSVWDIDVGKWAGSGLNGWPNGGVGASGFSTSYGGGGGGSTSMRPAGSTFADSIIVAAGGGGDGYGAAGLAGGPGSWIRGVDGSGPSPGIGATQSAGGAPNGAFNDGGDGGQTGGGPSLEGQGGGGGGWYGGGGGGASGRGGGGGGSSWLDFDIGVLEEVGEATPHTSGPDGGQLIISWEDPDI